MCAVGPFALNQTQPHVKDALNMLLWHDVGRCVCCGKKHFSESCALDNKAPSEVRKLMEKLYKTTAELPQAKAATSSAGRAPAAGVQAVVTMPSAEGPQRQQEHPLHPMLRRVAAGVEKLGADADAE